MRAVYRWRDWLVKGQEVSYPQCFWKQLGASAALFLLLFGLRQVQAQPVQAVLGGLRSVATTEINIGETIGKLEFVGSFVPESVMVFWNGTEQTLIAPFEDATLLSERDGWAVFEGRGAVLSGGEGAVQSVEATDGGYCLTIRYDNGLTGVMQPLHGVRTAPGERVHQGQSVGLVAATGSAGQVRVQVRIDQTPLEAKAWLR